MRATTSKKFNFLIVQCFNKGRKIFIYTKERIVESDQKEMLNFTLEFHITGKIHGLLPLSLAAIVLSTFCQERLYVGIFKPRVEVDQWSKIHI